MYWKNSLYSTGRDGYCRQFAINPVSKDEWNLLEVNKFHVSCNVCACIGVYCCMCMCVIVSIYVCMCVCLCLYVWLYVCLCVFVSMYVCVCLCLCVWLYVCMHSVTDDNYIN